MSFSDPCLPGNRYDDHQNIRDKTDTQPFWRPTSLSSLDLDRACTGALSVFNVPGLGHVGQWERRDREWLDLR